MTVRDFNMSRAFYGSIKPFPRFRKKPVEITAIFWAGGDYSELERFCGMNWGRADAKDILWQPADDGEQVVVYNAIDQQWLCVPKGFWIIRGVSGELYPCAPDIFERTYEAVDVQDADPRDA